MLHVSITLNIVELASCEIRMYMNSVAPQTVPIEMKLLYIPRSAQRRREVRLCFLHDAKHAKNNVEDAQDLVSNEVALCAARNAREDGVFSALSASGTSGEIVPFFTPPNFTTRSVPKGTPWPLRGGSRRRKP